MDKHALRKEMTAKRAVAAETVDQSAAQANLMTALQGRDGPISFFWPIRTEIDPRPVMEVLEKTLTVCLPMTHGRDAPLSFLRWTPDAPMTKDGFGVPMPDGTHAVVPTTLVVPMLAFDDRGHRLGYGAGHYDRTLAKLRPMADVLAIGYAFEAQHIGASLPTEPTDQPLDLIVTEAEIRRIKT